MKSLMLLLTFIPTLISSLTLPSIFQRACSSVCQTDKLLFQESLSQFLSAKAAESPASLIWTDDGCSQSPDRPSGFNFVPGCQRHDFGYRNFKAQGRLTEDHRGNIDQNLKDDLYSECAKHDGFESWRGVECRRIADIYYIAVRNFGNADVHIPDVSV
ncbi:MAG: hypothetical protein M1833_000754 [Piccolia ochrophora]|nr:MAG: hypothetical protein M1833_000754 [Piccolia ochrophora]